MKIRAESRKKYCAMFRGGLLLTGLLVVSDCTVEAQDVRPKLAVAETTVIQSMPDHATMLPIKTDRDGNIYVRFYQTDFGKAAIIKIMRSNSETTKYDLNTIPQDAFAAKDEKQRATISDFSVGPSDDLYGLVNTGAKSYFCQFSSRGEFEGLTELHGAGLASGDYDSFWQLVALPNQRFFVSGSRLRKGGGKEPLNEIFDANGGVVTEVAFKGDVQGSSQSTSNANDGGIDEGIQTGTALAGDDGNIYLMRGVSPFKVFVVSGGGQLLRTIAVQAPFERASLDTFKVHEGRLAIQFSRPVKADQPDEIVYRVIDSTTGGLIGDYEGSPETSRWVAYADDGFWYLGAKDGKLTRVRAAAP